MTVIGGSFIEDLWRTKQLACTFHWWAQKSRS